MLFALFLTGVLMVIIGTIVDRNIRAKQDREWEEVLRKRRASRTGR